MGPGLVPGLLLYFIFSFIWMTPSYSHNLMKIGTIIFIIILILQRRKVKHKEVENLAEGHIERKQQNQNLNQANQATQFNPFNQRFPQLKLMTFFFVLTTLFIFQQDICYHLPCIFLIMNVSVSHYNSSYSSQGLYLIYLGFPKHLAQHLVYIFCTFFIIVFQ